MMQTLRKIDDTLGLVVNDGAQIMFALFAIVVFMICLGYQQIAISHPYSLDYGEAPLVDHAMQLTRGENIYRSDISDPPYTISNYPPLYMLLIALSVKLAGPASSFLVGRAISALCCWIAAFCIFLIISALTRDGLAALAGAFVFLAFPYVVFWSPLLRIDMLALALSLCALTLLIWRPDSKLNFISAGLLLVAAIYTRQSYALTAPFAAFVWLLSRDWKQAFRLAALVGGLSLLLFILLNVLTGGGFFFNIVTANVNEFRMDQLIWYEKRLLEVALIPLLFGAASLLLPLVALTVRFIPSLRGSGIREWHPLWTLAAPYLIGSVLSAVTIGKIGSNVNYLLELCAGLALAAGAVIAWSRAHLRIQGLQAVLLFSVVFGIGKLMHFMLLDSAQDLRERRVAVTALHDLEDYVKKTPGTILADEYMGMLTLQGRPLTIQPFEVTQLARDGKWDQTPLLESINNKEYAAIILYDRPWSMNDRWTLEMSAAISKNYKLVDVIAENRIYKAIAPAVTESIDSCPNAKWRLPTNASLGVQWDDTVMQFFGRGNDGTVPVYAVADGFLTRLPEWEDLVAVLHENPENPKEKVWAFYGGMASATGDSFVLEEFPKGAKAIPVKSGQLLGYQGKWSGNPQWPNWLSTFLVLEIGTGHETRPPDYQATKILDPTPFMGLNIDYENENLQPLKCEQP